MCKSFNLMFGNINIDVIFKLIRREYKSSNIKFKTNYFKKKLNLNYLSWIKRIYQARFINLKDIDK
jgi:hypothetical protein